MSEFCEENDLRTVTEQEEQTAGILNSHFAANSNLNNNICVHDYINLII